MTDHTPLVALVSVTPNAEELIAYCARVSNPKNQNNPESDKLIRYLITNSHWSPFELAHMVLEIHTTRAISPQILRHRSFSFQEFSQRYAQVLDKPELPAFRRQDHKNRQNSIDDLDQGTRDKAKEITTHALETCHAAYQQLIALGIAKECSREVLPLATPTSLLMAGSIRSWLHYIDLRSANGTQKEHRDIALACRTILQQQLPAVCNAMWPQPSAPLPC